MDDREMWEGIRRKDTRAFDALYRTYRGGLHTL